MWKCMAAIMMALALALPVYAGELTTQVGSGTGFVVSPDGYILTNEHVIHGAESVSVTVNGTNYVASVVKANEAKDLALLKVDGRSLPVLAIATSSHVSVGDTVYALGCPRGICGTLSTGTVANLGIVFTNLDVALIMLDLTLTHGNSGGPLLNAQGEVIGVTRSGLLSSSGENASETGYSFAIPIDEANALLAIVPGIQRPGASQTGSALAAQEVRDKVGGAVAYVESRSEIPLATFLPKQVAGYGALSEPVVWRLPPPTPAPGPSTEDERILRIWDILRHPDGPKTITGSAQLSEMQKAEIAALVRDLLTEMDSLTLCSLLPGSPSFDTCDAIIKLLLGDIVTPRLTAPQLPDFDLLHPHVDSHLPDFDELDSAVGQTLRSPLDRLGVTPVAYARSTASKAFDADFLIAAFKDSADAASQAARIPGLDLSGMSVIETGTIKAGSITASYQIGYDTASNSWHRLGNPFGTLDSAGYQLQNAMFVDPNEFKTTTYYADASVCLRATVAFAMEEVLFAVSLCWTDLHSGSTMREQWGSPPGGTVGQYGYSSGCIRYTPTASSPEVLLCKDAALEELSNLLTTQLQALSAAVGG